MSNCNLINYFWNDWLKPYEGTGDWYTDPTGTGTTTGTKLYFGGYKNVSLEEQYNETENKITIKLTKPGLNKKYLKFFLEADKLLIEYTPEKEEKEPKFEYVKEPYTKTFSLPKGIKEENVDIVYHAGILLVTIQKTAPPKPEKKQLAFK